MSYFVLGYSVNANNSDPCPLVFTSFVRKTKCTDNYLEAKLSSCPLLYVNWEPWRKSSSDLPVSQQIKHLWAVKTKMLKHMLQHFSKPFFYLVYKFIEVYKEWVTDKLVCSSGMLWVTDYNILMLRERTRKL